MTSHAADITEEGRAFLQSRVALFAKVMIATQLVGLTGLFLQNPWERMWQPWLGLYQIQTGLAVGAWLLCRRGVRSARFVEVVDATVLLGLGVVSASISRLLQPNFLGEFLDGAVTAQDAAYGTMVARFQGSIGLTFVIGLSLWAFARAALVPSRPLRTLVLTALAGSPLALVTILPTFPFEAEPSLRSVMPEPLVAQNVLDVAIWWAFITTVCTIVSKVIFGLREQVREARRLGQYTLEAKLGEGGMGAVYRASHAMMRRPTAIKLVRPDQAGETNLARFEREVQLTARLSHPNTVTIFDYGRTPDGVFYYAMELLDGATLDEIVRVDGPQPPGRVLKVLAELASALEEAHDIGLIHRDIKPSNVIVCTQGGKPDVAKLLDFGLVKEVDQQGDVELTKETSLTGTPQYMCPEALTSPDAVDARSDLYALGAVGYFMLTGTPLFEGKTLVEVCSHHLHTEPDPPSKRLGGPVPDDLATLLLECLHKEPTDRPASAAELGRRLQACESMGEWTDEQARDWWDRHGESLRTVHAERGDSSTLAIAIDLART
jgi:serine/threonine-protein kinase